MEDILRRERAIVAGSLTVVIALAWIYLARTAASMSAMDMADMAMPMASRWTGADVGLLFVMWAVMMVAMMTPSAAPMVLTFLVVNRRRSAAGRPVVSSGVFFLGYVVVWTVFSIVATAAQWWMHEVAVLSPGMALVTPAASGVMLLAAGIFQWTPLKRTCLSHCRSPLAFVMGDWREGTAGAFRMGLHHGIYCVGCCWVLMALLFVGGAMNLVWIAALSFLVLVEKLIPAGRWLGRGVGVVLIAWGIATMLV